MRPPSTLLDVLEEHAARRAGHVAYRFVDQGLELTFGEVYAHAHALSAALRACTRAGDRIIVALPSGPGFVLAVLGSLHAGCIAVPTASVREPGAVPRLRGLIADARPTLVLTSREAPLPAELAAACAAIDCGVRILDDVPLEPVAAEPSARASRTALVQYTSGTTGDPVGVCVTHEGLLANQRAIAAAFGHGEDTVVAGWLPMHHDMGLIGNVLQPLFLGVPAVLITPAAFLADPPRWLELIARHGATTSGGPDFAYALCARRITPERREGLDLGRWRVAFTGAEMVRPQTLERFTRTFAPCGFQERAWVPCYGLAEATLLVSSVGVDAAPRIEALGPEDETPRRRVGCGPPRGCELAIVDPEGRPCADGVAGEILVHGPSVAEGYWGRPERTRAQFEARVPGRGDRPFLRTGDLGVLREGELFVLGRRKEVLVVRGRQLAPQDVEDCVQAAHPAFRAGCGAAFPLEDGEVVLVQEIRSEALARARELAALAHATVVEHTGVRLERVVLVAPKTLPKTTSGKLMRAACRSLYQAGRLAPLDAAHEPPGRPPLAEPGGELRKSRNSTPTMAAVERIVGEVLELEGPVAADEDLHRLGLDSMRAIELLHRLERELQLGGAAEVLRDHPTVRRLAAATPTARTPPHVDGREGLPLTPGQETLLVLHRLRPEWTAYHLAVALRLHAPLDVERLQRALAALEVAHPALRARFGLEQGRPRQRVDAPGRLVVRVEPLREPVRDRVGALVRAPFDLEAGSLVRAHLLQGDRPVLLLVMHHVIADAWGLDRLWNELGARLEGTWADDDPPAPYEDAVRLAQAPEPGSPSYEERMAYWRAELDGADEPLSLGPPPTGTGRAGVGTTARALPEAVVRAIASRARADATTPNAVMLATLEILLHRVTGRRRFVVGMPFANRDDPRCARVLGYFASVLPIRADIDPGKGLGDVLEHVRGRIAGAQARQGALPGTLLATRRGRAARRATDHPLFQVLYSFHDARRGEASPSTLATAGLPPLRARLGGIEVETVPLEPTAAAFDLTATVTCVGERMFVSLIHDRTVIDDSLAESLLASWEVLLTAALETPDVPARALPLVSSRERRRLVLELNDTVVARPEHGSPTRAFEHQVRASPDSPALRTDRETITYAELDRQANRLARRLARRGVGHDHRVGLLMAPTVECVVAILAILKLGAGYVSLDPRYPEPRLRDMLAAADVRVVVTDQARAHAPLLASLDAFCPALEPAPDGLAHDPLARTPSALAAAFVMFTSGSSGRPKGVVLTQADTLNHALSAARHYALRPGDRLIWFSSISFDNSVEELLATLLSGATLVVPGRVGPLAVTELLDCIEHHAVTVLDVPTAYWHELVRALEHLDRPVPSSLRLAKVGGETASPARLRRWMARGGQRIEWLNGYGPTEVTVGATFHRHPRGAEVPELVPIGRPHDNRRVYLLDEGLEPVPWGAVGELYLGGMGVARGYLGQPGATAAVFLPDPHALEPGARMYKTGDLARLRADGELEFLGRVDRQLKIRGHRIEPAAVEAMLLEHPSVADAAVVVRSIAEADGLVAYVVPTRERLDPVALRTHLLERLPSYSVPERLVELDRLPRLPNGKLDPTALPEPSPAIAEPTTIADPVDDHERAIAAIWGRVLGLARVGRTQSFFALGGSSLTLLTAHYELETWLGRRIPLSTLFEHPTVAALAQALARAEGEPDRARRIHDRALSRRQALLEQGRRRRSER